MNLLRHLFLLIIFSSLSYLQAQPPAVFQKSITVTGTAEMEIVPDEIYFRVVLKEYLKDKTTIQIDKLEKELIQAVTAVGIPKEDFMVESVYGDRWRRNKYKNNELYHSKSYIIKVKTPGTMDEILDKVQTESVYSVSIRNFTHSKMETFKKELKIKAMQAAKEKAAYMLQAVDEKLGVLLEVTENDNNPIPVPYPQMRQQWANVAYDSMQEAPEEYGEVGFQKIKIQFTVTTRFAIV